MWKNWNLTSFQVSHRLKLHNLHFACKFVCSHAKFACNTNFSSGNFKPNSNLNINSTEPQTISCVYLVSARERKSFRITIWDCSNSYTILITTNRPSVKYRLRMLNEVEVRVPAEEFRILIRNLTTDTSRLPPRSWIKNHIFFTRWATKMRVRPLGDMKTWWMK